MKKFLPLIIFVMAFAAAIVGQVGYQTLVAGTKTENEYASVEKQFLAGKFETIEGKKIENTKIKAPVVIYNFWASWCNPCIEEIPSLLAMKNKYKDDEVQILAFNTDEDEQMKNIQKIVRKLKIKNELNIIADKGTKISEGLKISAIPVTIIFNRGKVVHYNNGPMDFNSVEMNEKIKKWIKN